jgi:hypothetical protein
MKKKKLIVGAVLALAAAALLPRPASAGIWENGREANGTVLNGSSFQGVRLNGITGNGPEFQGLKVNGLRVNGALFQGGEHPIGRQCTERGVDFSAVPLASVTVRLPQRAR